LRKARLSAFLSHDLRTPLANIKLYTELAERRAGDDETLRRYYAVMAEETERLETLAAAAVAIGADVRRAAAVPDDILARALRGFDRRLRAAGCVVETHAGVSQLLRFDVVGFERALVNIIDNARKYAPGPIEVEMACESGWLRLSVSDHGPGFAASDGPRDGYGLGLQAVREIAEASGGRLIVERFDGQTRVTATFAAETVGGE